LVVEKACAVRDLADSLQALPTPPKDFGPPVVRTPVAGPIGIGSLLTVKQVAARLGVAAATVYGLCERRELHHVRVANAIRVSPDDLRAFLHAATADASKRRQMPSSENADATAASSPTSAASAIPSEGEKR
jgi:excisionase family DNA binding protein